MSSGVQIVRKHDARWPERLRVLEHLQPDQLYWLGAPWRHGARAVALVGSRRATLAGCETAAMLARGLAEVGIVVISGLARGIDQAAHAATARAGGVTIAVCGCGLDVDYPRGHRPLRDRIVAGGGALITEFNLGTEPRPGNFPQRNRLIAALAEAVVVVEATEASGALSTARWAADLGRDVLAVPGPLRSAQSRGSNLLLRDGVAPCLGVDDILVALGVPRAGSPGELPGKPALDRLVDPVLELLAGGPCHPDAVAATLEIGIVAMAVRLAELELDGLVRRLPGGLIELGPTASLTPGV